MSERAGAAVRAAPDRTYDLRIAALAALAGAAAFSALVVRSGLGSGGASDPRIAWLFTPVFVGPLAAYLVIRGRLGAAGVLGLVLALTAAHFTAIFVASAIYKAPASSQIMDIIHLLDTPAQKAQRAQAWAAKVALARRTAIEGGVAGGAIGAVVSFAALMLFGPAFRRPRALTAMAGAAVVLSALSGFAFMQRLPSDLTPTQFALWLFAPWQAVFGLTLAALFAGHRRPSRRR